MNSLLALRRQLLASLLALAIGSGLSIRGVAGCSTAKVCRTIVFMTDFGTLDDSVPICKGVMYSIMPEVRIVDLSHQVTPFSILDGARFLYGATHITQQGLFLRLSLIPPWVVHARRLSFGRSVASLLCCQTMASLHW